ncbi:MAG: hypothetical protein IJS08_06800 [Victivallales bacterium]|nr:hypothetical protein [Victivallales bacterium]
MEKIRRFICVITQTNPCNLKCGYCFLQHQIPTKDNVLDFKVDAKTFRRAFSRERLGGTCMFNFTANGETLIPPKLLDFVREVLEEGHFCEIVTNATVTKAFEKLATFPESLLSHLMLKCSFHYLELKKRGLLESFFANVHRVRNAGASITVELMPHDEIIPLIGEIQDRCIREVGAFPHVTVARDASQPKTLPRLSCLSTDEYRRVWGVFDSKLFEYKLSVFEKPQRDFCYAGDWMMVMRLRTGLLSQCYRGYRILDPFRDIDSPLDFKPIGNLCPEPHCFNAHAWLTFGCCPTADAPYYDEVRNRVCVDGTEWLTPECKAFFHQKFRENNDEYGFLKKTVVNAEMSLRKFSNQHRTIQRIVRTIRHPLTNIRAK